MPKLYSCVYIISGSSTICDTVSSLALPFPNKPMNHFVVMVACCINEQTDIEMNVWTYQWVGEWTNKWVNE